jgi:hypothetical protein
MDGTIALRATVIAGQRHADDYAVAWRGMPIGRIMQASGLPPHVPQWRWTCNVFGKPGGASGSGDDVADYQRQFRAAWATIRAGLSDANIAAALGIAETSREASLSLFPESNGIRARNRKKAKVRSGSTHWRPTTHCVPRNTVPLSHCLSSEHSWTAMKRRAAMCLEIEVEEGVCDVSLIIDGHRIGTSCASDEEIDFLVGRLAEAGPKLKRALVKLRTSPLFPNA